MDTSKAIVEWLQSAKSEQTRKSWLKGWNLWLQYCREKGLLTSAEQLADIKERRLSTDQTVKYFYDDEVSRFFKWLQTEYRYSGKQKRKPKPLSEGSALTVILAPRSFFDFYRYPLDVKICRAVKEYRGNLKTMPLIFGN